MRRFRLQRASVAAELSHDFQPAIDVPRCKGDQWIWHVAELSANRARKARIRPGCRPQTQRLDEAPDRLLVIGIHLPEHLVGIGLLDSVFVEDVQCMQRHWRRQRSICQHAGQSCW